MDGGGGDTFIFNTAPNTTTNHDKITDFNVAADTIWLDNAVFAALTVTGTLAAGAFFSGTAPHDASDRIIYNSATGNVLMTPTAPAQLELSVSPRSTPGWR